MKFLASAVSCLLLAGLSDASIRQVNSRKLSKATRQALLDRAMPVNRDLTTRRLDQEQQYVTAYNSVQFSTCVSIPMQNPNGDGDDDQMFSDDIVEYTKSGQIVAEKSYILFNVCEDDCYYQGEDNLYIVDLPTYLGATLKSEPERQQAYCEACRESSDWCLYGQYEDDAVDEEGEEEGGEEDGEEGEDGEGDEGEEDGEEGEDGEDRRRRRRRALRSSKTSSKITGRRLQDGQNYEVVDCDTCASMECLEDDQDENGGRRLEEDEMNMERIAEWVEQLSECQETGAQWNGRDLFAGFICNGDGSGVEIGVFLDEECSIYTSVKSYGNIAYQQANGNDDGNDNDEGAQNYQYYMNSQDVVTYPFLNAISCANRAEYITPEEYEEMQANDDQQQDENNDEEEEVNEYCGELFDDNVRSLSDCDANGVDDEEEDEVEEENDDQNNWYEYLLSQNDVENPTKVCYLLQTMEGEYTFVYNDDDNEGSGTFYDYSANRVDGKNGRGGANIALIIIGLLVAAICAVCILQNWFSSDGKSDARRERLIGGKKGGNGAMT